MAKSLVEKWKNEEDRSVIEILRGKSIGETGGKSFFRIAEALYLLSETDYKDRYIQKLENRASSSDKSLGKYYDLLAKENLVVRDDAEEGDKKRYTLTPQGEYVLDLISPLFSSLSQTYVLEDELSKFKDRYFRNPTKDEISIFVSDTVEQRDLIKTDNWVSPDKDNSKDKIKAIRHIASGFVLAHTDYNKIDSITPYTDSENRGEVDSSFIIRCSKVENPDNRHNDYASKHHNFLTRDLNYDISTSNGTIVELDDLSEKVTGKSKILVNRNSIDKNDELKIALSD